MPETTDPMMPVRPKRIWVQVVLVLFLAALAQVAGLVIAYLTRCRPGQGNDFCGVSSLASVLVGFLAAVMVLVAGLAVVFLRRKRVTGGHGAGGALRLMAAVFGAVLLVPCTWMIVAGWPRNNSDFIFWLGIGAGVGLLVAAFVRRGSD